MRIAPWVRDHFGWCHLLKIALAIGTGVPAGALASDLYEYDVAGRLTRVTYGSGRIASYAYDGNSNVTAIVSTVVVGVEPTSDTPVFVNALRAPSPNPASGEVRLRFSLARGGTATLRIYDVAGRLVRSLTDREYPPGQYEARTSVSRWASGVYFYQLDTPGFRATRRLLVLRR